MALKRTKASDAAHKRLSILIYGEPKVGKTSLAKTLPVTSDDKLLYVAADPGQLALRDRDFVVVQPQNGQLTEAFFDEVLDHIRAEGGSYEWIFVDGVDEVADAILKAKLKTQRDGRKAFGEMAEYVETWMKAIRDVEGISVVFVTHIDKDDIGEGEVQFIPQFPGKKIQEQVDAWFDLIGCMRLVKTSDGGYARQIQFRREGDSRYMVGDRSGVLGMYEDPDLGALFNRIHAAGLVTRGTFTPVERLVTDDDLRSLGGLAEKLTIIETCKRLFGGRGPREITLSELRTLESELTKNE